MTAEVPSDSARTRVIVWVVLGIIAFVVVVAAAWYSIGGGRDVPVKQTEIEPAQDTSTATSTPVPNGQPTTTAPQPGTGTSGGDGVQPQPGAGERRIAYRVGDTLYVADEDGANAQPVPVSGQSYSLSPDGRTVAVVSDATGGVASINLIDVATGLARPVGRGAVLITPSWAPDSSWLAYTAEAGGIWVIKGVASDGTGDAVLIQHGAMPSISTDGRIIAFKTNDQPGQEDPLLVLTAGATESRVVKSSDGALSWAWGPGPTLYFTREDTAQDGRWQLWAYKDGKTRRLGAVELEAPAFALGDLIVSKDGAWIAMSMIGDDDYSRLAVFSTKAARLSRIATRRDAYPSAWSADGRILYFEGNSYQGEPSALVSIRPDGTGKRTVLQDAQP